MKTLAKIKKSTTAQATPTSHPNRPQEWTDRYKVKRPPCLDRHGIEDKDAFIIDGHNQSAMKCLMEGVVGVFSPKAKYVEGDVVYVFAKNGDQYFGRIYYPSKSVVCIVGDCRQYFADIVHRKDIRLIAALVERRIEVPHGEKMRDVHRYASDPKNRQDQGIAIGYSNVEQRIDSHIASDKLFAAFKASGLAHSTLRDLNEKLELKGGGN